MRDTDYGGDRLEELKKLASLGSMGAFNWAPIMPRGASLSDSLCTFLQSFRGAIDDVTNGLVPQRYTSKLILLFIY